jgi:SAM-dependent methyltransferase
MRILDSPKVQVDEASIIEFFEERARKYDSENNPNVTMLQDGNEAIAVRRSAVEVEAIRDVVAANGFQRPSTLDIGCGSGRLYFELRDVLGSYTGVDGACTLIESARNRLAKETRPGDPPATFLTHALGMHSLCRPDVVRPVQLVIMSGIIAYLNDGSVASLFLDLMQLTGAGTVLIVREPLGIEHRLTLKEHWSDALSASYNAIYRTRKEVEAVVQDAFGECIADLAFRWLYSDPALNNRVETRQGFFAVRLR